MILYANRIYTKEGCQAGYIEVEDGKFKNFYPADAAIAGALRYDEYCIIPGILDTHNHGGFGVRVDPGCTKEEMKLYLKGLASEGVTGVFPTTFELEGIRLAADMAEEVYEGAKILGIHSEGPWGARVGEKGINLGYPSVDMEYARQMVENGKGKLKLVAIAPEVDGAEQAIAYFLEHGVRMAIYHTNANYEEANCGIDLGITVATHLGNVMTGLHHRDVGTLGACLLRDEVYCEIICDGLHVSLPMVQIMMKVKPHDQIMMVSDNVQYAGAPVGYYRRDIDAESDRSVIEVTAEGFVLSKSGRLSGSSKSVLYGMKNLVQKLGMPLDEVVLFSSLNPCTVYGFSENKGSIEVGKDADFVIINDNFEVQETYLEGRKIFDRFADTELFNQEFINRYKID